MDINEFFQVLQLLQEKDIKPTRLKVGEIEADLSYVSLPTIIEPAKPLTKEEKAAEIERRIFNNRE